MRTKQINKIKWKESSYKVGELHVVSFLFKQYTVHEVDCFGMLGRLKFSVGSQEAPLTTGRKNKGFMRNPLYQLYVCD